MNPPPTPPRTGFNVGARLPSSPPGRGEGWVGSWKGSLHPTVPPRNFTGLPVNGRDSSIIEKLGEKRMKRSSFFVVSSLFLVFWAGCVGAPRKPALRASDYQGTIRVACVGDSITFGAGVENRENNCYPVVLGKLLGSRFDVRNFGVSGATLLKNGDLSYWKLPQFEQLTGFAPQVIILALG